MNEDKGRGDSSRTGYAESHLRAFYEQYGDGSVKTAEKPIEGGKTELHELTSLQKREIFNDF